MPERCPRGHPLIALTAWIYTCDGPGDVKLWRDTGTYLVSEGCRAAIDLAEQLLQERKRRPRAAVEGRQHAE